jgi:hypothetical protein
LLHKLQRRRRRGRRHCTTTHELHDDDPDQTVEVIARINVELKPEQLSISTTTA